MCNCKKQQVVEPQPVPQTPDEQHTQDMNKWNGGIENDMFNNIDTIEPITKDGHND